MVFYSENELNLQNIKEECVSGQWMAVASYNDQKDKIIYFDVFSIATDFVKRNFNKNEMIGLITIPNKDIRDFVSQGIEDIDDLIEDLKQALA